MTFVRGMETGGWRSPPFQFWSLIHFKYIITLRSTLWLDFLGISSDRKFYLGRLEGEAGLIYLPGISL